MYQPVCKSFACVSLQQFFFPYPKIQLALETTMPQEDYQTLASAFCKKMPKYEQLG